MSEREILQREVAAHAERVAEISARLNDLEAGDDDGAPHARQIGLLRMELKGRVAAVAIGSARLKMLRPD